MRILHVLDHSLPVQSGYATRSAAIIREQRRLGWETIQVTGPKHGPASAASELIDGIEYHRTTSRCGWLERVPAGKQLEAVRLLRASVRQLVRRARPDIIHAHSPCLNGLAVFGMGIPVVYELRSSWEDAAVSTGTTTEGSLRYRASRWLETRVLRSADAVTTICEGLRAEAIRRGVDKDKVAVIANAVDAEGLAVLRGDPAELRRRFGLKPAHTLGFIGSFFAWEGLTLLIEALPRILASRPDTRLLLVGGGIEESALRAACQRFGVEEAVIFAGQVPHGRVGAFYAAIDLLIYPRLPIRLTEMVTPLKPLEAMALGKPLVASNVGGHRELIRDGVTGALFAAGDAEALAQAVLRVMGDPELVERLKENGPRHVRDERTWGRVVRNYEPVYRHLLGP